VVTEAAYLIAARLGTEAEARFLGDLAAGAFTVEPVAPPHGGVHPAPVTGAVGLTRRRVVAAHPPGP